MEAILEIQAVLSISDFSLSILKCFLNCCIAEKEQLFIFPLKESVHLCDLFGMKQLEKIGFGGGCHWCTEAIFDSLDGVEKVDQGYVASSGENELFSEAVIVHFDSALISLKRLIKIHMETHSSTSSHSFRKKYRSAVYFFTEDQKIMTDQILKELQKIYPEKLITKVLNFSKFKASRESIQKYYKKNPDAPFCKKYILPKLNKISAI